MTASRHAVVSLAALDVRREPDHRSELTSQLLLGEGVACLGLRGEGTWWRVEGLADGYRGWVRSWGLVPASLRRIASWQDRASARVSVPVLEVRALPGRGAMVSPLYLNSVVIPGARRGRHRRVELPDGRRGWVPASCLSAPGERPSLDARIRSLLGVPYHWGGRTPLGFDCSGFTQQVLVEQGVALPRDCQHQYRASRPLPRGRQPDLGDLVFFAAPGQRPGHVGIGLGGGYFAHCRGRVMISTLETGNPLCANDLVGQFVAWMSPGPAP